MDLASLNGFVLDFQSDKESAVNRETGALTKLKLILKYVLGAFFVLAGLNHFINPVFYMEIVPPYLPWHALLVYVSGLFEVALGIGIMVPRFTYIAAWGLISLLIAIFPANVHMALNSEFYPEISPIALWVRLPLQGILIVWAYWYTSRNQAVITKQSAI